MNMNNEVETSHTGLKHLSTGTIGALSELIACADLMRKGYEVFRAMSQSSNCDAVAIKDGIVLKLEIRTGIYQRMATNEIKLRFPKIRIDGKSVVVVTPVDNKVHYIDFEP